MWARCENRIERDREVLRPLLLRHGFADSLCGRTTDPFLLQGSTRCHIVRGFFIAASSPIPIKQRMASEREGFSSKVLPDVIS